MPNPQDLIAKLKAQHRTLQADLSSALDDSKLDTGKNGESIVAKLTKFKSDLLEHLKLENEEFYPDYLDKKTKRGEDVITTKEFIRQMDDIGKAVMDFLGKYSSSDVINTASLSFGEELSGIIGTLNTRIETEEEGLFDLYLLL